MYVSLNGEIIPNHGRVMISDIGSTDSTALTCHTNKPSGGGNSGGDWFAPELLGLMFRDSGGLEVLW